MLITSLPFSPFSVAQCTHHLLTWHILSLFFFFYCLLSVSLCQNGGSVRTRIFTFFLSENTCLISGCWVDAFAQMWNSCGMLTHFSWVQLFATIWTITRQAPLSMGFSKQGYYSGLPCPPPRDLPDPGIKPMSLTSPALAGGFFTTITLNLPFWSNKIYVLET